MNEFLVVAIVLAFFQYVALICVLLYPKGTTKRRVLIGLIPLSIYIIALKDGIITMIRNYRNMPDK